jgi:DNA-binding transcriptional MocR family regulator
MLRRYPDVLVIEDDHAGWVCDVPLHALHTGHPRWVYLRSFSKAFNPDLRLAAVTGDADTINRLEDREFVGKRWVSHILQETAAELLNDRAVTELRRQAASEYARRRETLRRELASRGIESAGWSGYNVWIPVAEESATVQAMFQRGFSVSPGERYRIQSPPAIRITAANLNDADARNVAANLGQVLAPSERTLTA